MFSIVLLRWVKIAEKSFSLEDYASFDAIAQGMMSVGRDKIEDNIVESLKNKTKLISSWSECGVPSSRIIGRNNEAINQRRKEAQSDLNQAVKEVDALMWIVKFPYIEEEIFEKYEEKQTELRKIENNLRKIIQQRVSFMSMIKNSYDYVGSLKGIAQKIEWQAYIVNTIADEFLYREQCQGLSNDSSYKGEFFINKLLSAEKVVENILEVTNYASMQEYALDEFNVPIKEREAKYIANCNKNRKNILLDTHSAMYYHEETELDSATNDLVNSK